MRVRLAAYVPTNICPSHFNPIFASVTRRHAGFVKPRTDLTTICFANFPNCDVRLVHAYSLKIL